MMSDVLTEDVQEMIRRYAWHTLTHSYAHSLNLSHAEVAQDMTVYLVEREANCEGWIKAHTASYIACAGMWHVMQMYKREFKHYRAHVWPEPEEWESLPTPDDFPEDFNDLLAGLTEPARSFVDDLLSIPDVHLYSTGHSLSRQVYMRATGKSRLDYMRGRLSARQQLAARFNNNAHYQREAAHDLERARNGDTTYHAQLLPSGRGRNAHGQFTSLAVCT